MLGFGGIANSIFSVMEKKELNNLSQQWVMAKLKSIKKMYHTHIP